jgi:hypothetical protein
MRGAIASSLEIDSDSDAVMDQDSLRDVIKGVGKILHDTAGVERTVQEAWTDMEISGGRASAGALEAMRGFYDNMYGKEGAELKTGLKDTLMQGMEYMGFGDDDVGMPVNDYLQSVVDEVMLEAATGDLSAWYSNKDNAAKSDAFASLFDVNSQIAAYEAGVESRNFAVAATITGNERA